MLKLTRFNMGKKVGFLKDGFWRLFPCRKSHESSFIFLVASISCTCRFCFGQGHGGRPCSSWRKYKSVEEESDLGKEVEENLLNLMVKVQFLYDAYFSRYASKRYTQKGRNNLQKKLTKAADPTLKDRRIVAQ